MKGLIEKEKAKEKTKVEEIKPEDFEIVVEEAVETDKIDEEIDEWQKKLDDAFSEFGK